MDNTEEKVVQVAITHDCCKEWQRQYDAVMHTMKGSDNQITAETLDKILDRIKQEIAKAYVAHFSFEDICKLLDKIFTDMKAEISKG